jgi:hypothetical protein
MLRPYGISEKCASMGFEKIVMARGDLIEKNGKALLHKAFE